jgi:hypothetical protein
MSIILFDFLCTVKSGGMAKILHQELTFLSFACGAFHG